MEDDLKVPLGLSTTGEPVTPADATKGEAYLCPGCELPLTLKKGEVKRPHFAHQKGTSCTQESIFHKLGKLVILRAFRDWREGHHAAPVIRLPCITPGCTSHTDIPALEKWDRAGPEAYAGKFRLDVALYAADVLSAGIEVVYTHFAEQEKVDECPVPFLEVEAVQVIADPWVWRRINKKPSPRQRHCAECVAQRQREEELRRRLEEARRLREEEERAAEDERQRLAREARARAEQARRVDEADAWRIASDVGMPNLALLRRRYVAKTHECYACRRRTPVFAWDAPRGTDGRPTNPPFPRPASLGRDRVNRLGRLRWEWVDRCVHCQSVQHPFYVWESGEPSDERVSTSRRMPSPWGG